ncbi:MAG TPA: hypothetical protein VGX51_05530 [Solirubrobacteraceae bacterium]|nr:hypothetical protein [Solirubrobacteraceae bacterium]
MNGPQIKWLAMPKPHDYEAAQQDLELVLSEKEVKHAMHELRAGNLPAR